MPELKRLNEVLKASMSVAVGLLFMGPSGAHAGETAGAVKLTASSPGNIRTETCSRPEYPEQELKQNHQGTVTLRFLIGADGIIKRSLVQTSSGFPALDEAALAGISKCRFNPPLVKGKPVEAWTAIQYVWKPQ
ncbi:energy transducer TonB [Massilia sp. UMI-21]|nr:energy transducer TonB [Massilia sp. UMI-21]